MAIDAGDVVLTFLSDTTELDKAFDKVSDQASQVKDDLSPVNDAVGGLGDKFKTVGTSAEDGFQKVGAAATTADVATKGAGESAAAFALRTSAGAGEAATAISGVGTAASVIGEIIAGAFAAGVVFLFVEALLFGISKMEDLDAKAKAIADAWDKVDAVQRKVFDGLENDLIRAQIKTAELTDNNLEALRLKLQLIDNVSLEKLEAEIKKIADEADRAFKKLEPGIVQRLYGFNATDDVKKEFKEISKTVEDALSPRTPQAYSQALGVIDAELAKIQLKMNELSAKDKPVTVGGFVAPGVDPTALKSWDELHGKLEEYKKDIHESQAAEQEQKKGATLDESKKYWESQIALAKKAEEAELANIDKIKQEQFLLYTSGQTLVGDWAVAQVKAANDARIAHENYLQRVVELYTKAGDATKAKVAQQDLDNQRVKDAAKLTEELGKFQEELRKNTDKYNHTAAETWKQTQKDLKLGADAWKTTTTDIEKATYAEQILAKIDPFSPQVKKVLSLNDALKDVGINATKSAGGFLPLNQQLHAAEKAEKLLNDAGIHDGRIWLQVQQAKLKAIIALQQAEGKASRDTVEELKKVEGELRKYSKQTKETQATFSDMMEKMKKDAEDFTLAIGDAFGAALAGQKSIGEAMIEASAHMVGQMANQWAQYFAAMGIADIWWHPAKGAAELAAAVALETLAAALGSVGSGSSSGSGSKTDWQGGSDNSAPTQSQPQPTGGQNVPHLAGGGLVTGPTLAVVGDARNGGSAREAVLPLDNADAMRSIAEAIGANAGGGVTHNWYIQGGMISADTMSKVAKRVSRDVQSGRVRLKASDSARITRRS